jgi:hypothetical protein
MGRSVLPLELADEIQDRLRCYLVKRYGSIKNFKRRARRYGWFRPNTIGTWFERGRAPDTVTIVRLLWYTGLNPTWLFTGIGVQRDVAAQFTLGAKYADVDPRFLPVEVQPKEEKEKKKRRALDRLGPGVTGKGRVPAKKYADPEKEAENRPAIDQDDPLFHLDDFYARTVRFVDCRYRPKKNGPPCGRTFRQHMVNPQDQDSAFEPEYCPRCRELIGIRQRKEELKRQKAMQRKGA